jgi:hypothetical protein
MKCIFKVFNCLKWEGKKKSLIFGFQCEAKYKIGMIKYLYLLFQCQW